MNLNLLCVTQPHGVGRIYLVLSKLRNKINLVRRSFYALSMAHAFSLNQNLWKIPTSSFSTSEGWIGDPYCSFHRNLSFCGKVVQFDPQWNYHRSVMPVYIILRWTCWSSIPVQFVTLIVIHEMRVCEDRHQMSFCGKWYLARRLFFGRGQGKVEREKACN